MVTLEEFLAAPETEPRREYVAGQVVERPALAERERWLRADLATLLYGWARAMGRGAVATEVRCTFGGGSYVPDIVYFAERPAEAAGGPVAGLHTAPDFVVEICPAAVDPAWFAPRMAAYVAHAVRLAWLIDPGEQVVTVYAPGAAPRLVTAGEMLEGGAVLPGFYLYVDDLFAVLEEG
jgi:Uma2 family endonuclease